MMTSVKLCKLPVTTEILRETITQSCHKLTPCIVNKDKWRTQVSVYHKYCSMPKGICLAKAVLNSENVKSVHPLSHCIDIIMFAYWHQVASQWKILLNKFCSNLLGSFQVILKTHFSLVIPHQYCQDVMKVL